MGKVNLQLILSDRAQELLDHFARIMELRYTFFDLNGVMISRGLKMRNCEYCRMLQEDFGKLPQCLATDQMMRSMVQKNSKVVHYTCHAGLDEVIAPVTLAGEPAGFLMIGQFRKIKAEMPCFQELSASEKKALEKAFKRVPQLSSEKVNAVTELMLMLLDYLTAKELATVSGDKLRYEVERYIARHIAEEVRLPVVAKRLGKSISSLTHELKNRYGVTFSQLLTQARISRAEEIMTAKPGIGIAEIALAVGIDDPYYFSRLYRRIRGFPPSEFKNQAAAKKTSRS